MIKAAFLAKPSQCASWPQSALLASLVTNSAFDADQF
jgi:hypothetical protein